MSRCSICDPSCRFVKGDGPEPCDFMFIGEKPGREEDGKGRPFIGDTGREFNQHYLGLAGLTRDDIYITNTVKCRLGGNNNKPSEEQVQACAPHHLPGEVERTQPSVLVLMGATACSLVPKIQLDKDHGMPVRVQNGDSNALGGWEGWAWPTFHPASGLHQTSMMIPLMEDFERLGRWRRGRWRAPKCVESRRDYKVVKSSREIAYDLTIAPSSYDWLPIDTENDGAQPWSLQYSVRPGHGRMIMADRAELLQGFADYVAIWDGLLLHNAVHDLEVLGRMGIHPRRFRDTMQEAYHLGNQPQGLKALAWRLLGIRMRSWEDVVLPHSQAKMREWLMAAWDAASDRLRVRVEKQLKTKVSVTYKPSEVERAAKRIMSHSHKPEYDLWEKVEEARLGELVGEWAGEPPKKSIAHVPVEEAIEYACQDADVTGQVGVVLERLRQEIAADGGEWDVEEEDWDQ